MADMLIHIREFHDIKDVEVHLTEFEGLLKKEFYETQIRFDNGLVLFNQNLIGSEYDQINNFLSVAKEWMKALKSQFIHS